MTIQKKDLMAFADALVEKAMAELHNPIQLAHQANIFGFTKVAALFSH